MPACDRDIHAGRLDDACEILAPMSRENVDALRPIYDEWGRGNFTPKFEVYADDMEWGWSPEFPGLAGVYRDPAERNARLHEWLSPWEHWTLRDGRVVRLEVFADRARALESVGLAAR